MRTLDPKRSGKKELGFPADLRLGTPLVASQELAWPTESVGGQDLRQPFPGPCPWRDTYSNNYRRISCKRLRIGHDRPIWKASTPLVLFRGPDPPSGTK